MAQQRTRAAAEALTFRSLVKDCAAEPQLVASFNKVYGFHLQAPIRALLEDRWLEVSAEEEIQIGCFIVFIHEHVWLHLQRAQSRMGRVLDSA